MNVTNLVLYLKSKITDQTLDQQMVSKAIKQLELGTVFQVAAFSSLPSPVGMAGQLYWIPFDGLYYSDGVVWLPIAESYSLAWTWGCNSYGQLGECTPTNRSSPVPVVGGFSDWCQISAGRCVTAAVRTSGSAWAWGRNGYGQLGDNTVTNRSSPVSVVGNFSDWCQISNNGPHTAAVRTGGSAWAWGFNLNGQLGDNTVTQRSSPVSVVGGFTSWCQVSAGLAHTAAVRTNGSAWAWGYNYNGRLGDNTTTNRSSPVSVVGGFSDWCQISAGSCHTAAVRTGGSAWSWGFNNSGQLGDNTSTSRSSPVSVVGGFTNWCQISAGLAHTAAVRTSGSAWDWGNNYGGRLGDNTVTNRSSPVSVVGGFSDWCQISAGRYHTAAVRTSGSAWSWGYNNVGQLGDNTVTHRSSPVSVLGGCTNWCQISAGFRHTAAIRASS